MTVVVLQIKRQEQTLRLSLSVKLLLCMLQCKTTRRVEGLETPKEAMCCRSYALFRYFLVYKVNKENQNSK